MTEQHSGRTLRMIAGLGMAGLAAVFAFLLLVQDAGEGIGGPNTGLFVSALLASHAIGGFVAGWILAGLFGRGGPLGGLIAVIGGIPTTLLAGLIGGTVATLIQTLLGVGSVVRDVLQIAVGALIVPLATADRPWVGLLWIILILTVHLFVLRSRRTS